MADLVSYAIPNLIQGISQQPDAQRDPTQAAIQINGVSSIAEGLRKRDFTRSIARVSTSSFGDAFIHSILRDQSEEYLAVITDSGIQVFDLEGNEINVVENNNSFDYLSSVTDARQQIRAVTVADYTFITNLNTVTAMDTATAPENPRPRSHECLIWIRAANYGQTYTVNVNGVQVKVETPVAPVVSSGGSVTENRISSEDIADAIVQGLKNGGLTSGYNYSQQGSVIWLRSNNALAVEVSDARSNADITAILNSVQAFTELPTIAPIGYQVAITGDPGNNFDGYYVEFEPRGADIKNPNNEFDEGSWLECVSPGVEYKIDPDTMPHVLIRRANGTFWFGAVNGQTVSNIPGDVPEWGRRTCGDYDTAPDPSFIGYPINDVFIYKNRLGFLADENVILSQSSKFFKFFPDTVTTVLDTDPIDLVASNNKVSILRYAVPYQDELILFSAQYQFRFNAAETVLTPKTAQLTVLTQFDVDVNVRPQQAGGGIMFAQQNGEWSQIREFSVRGAGTALTADAADLTGYVSSYIPSELFKMTVNDTGNALFAISGKASTGAGSPEYRNRIYVYKYFYRNQGAGVERAQSSWSHFELSSAARILQVLCVREELYLLVQYGDDVYLERMSVKDRQEETDGFAPYALLLDRRVTSTTETPTALRVAAPTYDEQNDQSTFTIPFQMRGRTQIWSMWDMSSQSSTGPVLIGEEDNGTTITARGDWRTTDVMVGEPYEFRYRFTKFKMTREIGGGKAAANAMRTQIRTAKLRYHETGYFEVHVLPEFRPEGCYVYDGTISGVRNAAIGKPQLTEMSVDSVRFFEGVFSVPIYGQGEQVLVEIRSDKPIPCKFSTCEWIALVSSRARALQ